MLEKNFHDMTIIGYTNPTSLLLSCSYIDCERVNGRSSLKPVDLDIPVISITINI